MVSDRAAALRPAAGRGRRRSGDREAAGGEAAIGEAAGPRRSSPPAGPAAGVVAFAVLLVLTGCAASPAATGPSATFASVPVGDNLLGEPCDMARAEASPDTFDVHCGTWEQPSARLVRRETAAPLTEVVASGDWRDRLDDLATCAAPEPVTILGDLPALELTCVIRRGGWPYRALAVRAGGTVYLADAIPAAEPVMERAVARLAGRQPADAPAQEIGSTGPLGQFHGARTLYSAGDLSNWRDLLRQAQYHNYAGEHPEAERLYRKALALQDERLPAAAGGRAWLLMSLALELSNQERFLEADAVFAQAEAALGQSFDEEDEARLASYRAIHYANQRRGQKAIELAREASERRLALAAEAGPALVGRVGLVEPGGFVTGGAGTTLRGARLAIAGRGETALGDTVQSRSIEAAMLLRQGRLDEADAALAQASALFDAESRLPRHWGAQLRYLEAMVAERRGDPAAAESLLQSGLAGVAGGSGKDRSEATMLLALGRVQAAEGRRGPALESFRRGIEVVQARREGLLLEDVWPFFDVGMAEAAADPSARRQLTTEMFGAAQLVRSSRTSQSIALASARLSASDRAAGRLIRELQDARRDRDLGLETLARAQTDPGTLGPQLEALEVRQHALETKVADLEREVQAAAPRYHQLLDAPITAEAALGVLRPDEALVQILVGEERSLVLFADAQGVDVYPVSLSEREAERVVRLLRAPFDQFAGAPYDVGAAHTLFRTLFDPVAARLARARHLIVVPSGPLLSMPFGALVEALPPPVTAGDYTQVAWLAKARAVTLAPSVQAFAGLRDDAQASHATKPLVGFGDFVPERDAKAVLGALGLPDTCRPQVEAISAMPRLPATAGELEAVRAALGASAADVRLGRSFTEAGVRGATLRDYRVVYFATHALLPRDFDCWSEPMLLASASEGDGGLLRASEVADLDLDADLVVLSACNTAAPDGGSGGESLSGLARAFFYAGARSLLVTHWRIPDEPTRMLMTRLFGTLSTDDPTVAEALRRAQTALIDTASFSHPLNWAAFSLVGDGGLRLQAPALLSRAG